MSGIDELMAESSNRWADARRRAEGVQDCGLGRAVKTYYTRYFPAGLLVPAARSGRIDVLLSLTGEEQKQVRRQIAGKASVDREHLAVTRAAAVQLRKGLARQLLLQPASPLVFIPQAMNFALRGDSSVALAMAMGAGAAVVQAGFLVRNFRRAGHFLGCTAEQAAPGSASPCGSSGAST